MAAYFVVELEITNQAAMSPKSGAKGSVIRHATANRRLATLLNHLDREQACAGLRSTAYSGN